MWGGGNLFPCQRYLTRHRNSYENNRLEKHNSCAASTELCFMFLVVATSRCPQQEKEIYDNCIAFTENDLNFQFIISFEICLLSHPVVHKMPLQPGTGRSNGHKSFSRDLCFPAMLPCSAFLCSCLRAMFLDCSSKRFGFHSCHDSSFLSFARFPHILFKGAYLCLEAMLLRGTDVQADPASQRLTVTRPHFETISLHSWKKPNVGCLCTFEMREKKN